MNSKSVTSSVSCSTFKDSDSLYKLNVGTLSVSNLHKDTSCSSRFHKLDPDLSIKEIQKPIRNANPNPIIKTQSISSNDSTNGVSRSTSLESVASTMVTLETSWSLWFHKHKASKPWKDNIKYVTTVEYVEDFLSLYAHLYPISKMDHGCDYMFFKKGIEPMEEDIYNIDGGRWVIYFNSDDYSLNLFEYYWFKLLKALVNRKFLNKMEFINGAWAKVRRRGCELELWTRSAHDSEVQIELGKQLRDLLDISNKLICFKEHLKHDINTSD